MATRREDHDRAGAGIESAIAELAARQHGVITRDQLLGAGLTENMVHSRLRSGRLLLLHRGVYLLGALVGPLRPARYREMAAVLACGRGAALSHWSALWLRDLLPARPSGDAVHLVLPGHRCRRPGVVAHRVSALRDEDVGSVDGIPTTSAARTILDIAAVARPRDLEQVIARAERLELVDRQALLIRLRRSERRRGVALLRAILTRGAGPAYTRSQAEERLLELVREARLPEPQCNVRIGDYEADFLWPAHGVALEVDGFAYHSSRQSFERDRARDFALAAARVLVVRVTWRQLRDQSYALIRLLSVTLARAEDARRPSLPGIDH